MERFDEQMLYVVAECPVSPGFGGVVVLKSLPSRRLIYFAPCCGVAWREVPARDSLDDIGTIADIDAGDLVLPTLADLRDAGLENLVLRLEPLANWQHDVPIAMASKE